MSAALVVTVALVPARASPGPVGALLCALLSVVGVALRDVTGVAGHGQYLCAQISQFGVRKRGHAKGSHCHAYRRIRIVKR